MGKGRMAVARPRKATDGKAYHHGALRDALVEAGLAILEERGLEGLSLRACAERLGVSHAAPAHHFQGVKALTSALAAVGFGSLTRRLQAARADSDDPFDAIKAVYRAYLGFVAESPQLFRLMFSAPRVNAEDAALREAAAAAYGELAALSSTLHDVMGEEIGMSELQTEQMLWSVVHGYAELYVGNQIACSPDEIGRLAEEAGAFADILRRRAPER